jgi:hypothetical protein
MKSSEVFFALSVCVRMKLSAPFHCGNTGHYSRND